MTEAEKDEICAMVGRLCAHVLLDIPIERKAAPMADDLPINKMMVQAEPWIADAECAGMDTNLFFPERGVDVQQAKKVCERCTVRAACLDYAEKQGIRNGVWGGTSELERRKMRGRRGMPRAAYKVTRAEWGDLTPRWVPRAQVETRMLEARHGCRDWTKAERDAVRATLRYALDSGQAEGRVDESNRRWIRLVHPENAAA